MQLNLSWYQLNIDYLNYDILCKPQGNHKNITQRRYTKKNTKESKHKKLSKTQKKTAQEEKTD